MVSACRVTDRKPLWKQMETHDRKKRKKKSAINVMHYRKAGIEKCKHPFFLPCKHQWCFSLETINQQHDVIPGNGGADSLHKSRWRTRVLLLKLKTWRASSLWWDLSSHAGLGEGKPCELISTYLTNEALDHLLLKCLFFLSRGEKKKIFVSGIYCQLSWLTI